MKFFYQGWSGSETGTWITYKNIIGNLWSIFKHLQNSLGHVWESQGLIQGGNIWKYVVNVSVLTVDVSVKKPLMYRMTSQVFPLFTFPRRTVLRCSSSCISFVVQKEMITTNALFYWLMSRCSDFKYLLEHINFKNNNIKALGSLFCRGRHYASISNFQSQF